MNSCLEFKSWWMHRFLPKDNEAVCKLFNIPMCVWYRLGLRLAATESQTIRNVWIRKADKITGTLRMCMYVIWPTAMPLRSQWLCCCSVIYGNICIRTFFFAFYEIIFSVRFAIYMPMRCMEQTLPCTQQWIPTSLENKMLSKTDIVDIKYKQLAAYLTTYSKNDDRNPNWIWRSAILYAMLFV